MKDSKILIVSNFINDMKSEIFLENKNCSVFARFKKMVKKVPKELFINELNDFVNENISNKRASSNDQNSSFDKKLDNILEKYISKCEDKVEILKEKLLRMPKNQEKTPNISENYLNLKKINVIDLKRQMNAISKSLTNLKSQLPHFGRNKSTTYNASQCLSNIYIKLSMVLEKDTRELKTKSRENAEFAKKVSEEIRSPWVYDLIIKVESLISSAIASRLVKNAKHFGDSSKRNVALADVYNNFSKLAEMLFGSPFKKLETQVNNCIRSINFENTPGKNAVNVDCKRLGYYVEIIDKDLEKFRKLKSFSDFSSRYSNLKTLWSKCRSYLNINKIKRNQLEIKNEDLKKNLLEILKQLNDNKIYLKETCIKKIKSSELSSFNKILQVVIDLINEFNEIHEILYHDHKTIIENSKNKLAEKVKIDDTVTNLPTISIDENSTKEMMESLSRPKEKLQNSEFKSSNLDNTLQQLQENERDNLNNEDLSKMFTIDMKNNVTKLADYISKHNEKAKNLSGKLENKINTLCELISYNYQYLYSNVIDTNSEFYKTFYRTGYESAYGGPYTVYNRLYYLEGNLHKIKLNSVENVTLDNLYDIKKTLNIYSETVQDCLKEIDLLKDPINEYNKKYPNSANEVTEFYNWSNQFLNFFLNNIIFAIQLVNNTLSFYEKEKMNNIFISNDCKRKKILNNLQKELNSDKKINYICELLTYDIQIFKDMQNGNNIPAPPKGWIELGGDMAKKMFNKNVEEYPLVSQIKLIAKEICSTFPEDNQISMLLNKEQYSLTDIESLLEICNEINKKLSDLKLTENNLIKIVKDDISRCFDCIKIIKENYTKEKYILMFENPDRKQLLDKFKSTNDLDSKLFVLLNLGVKDIEILYSKTSSTIQWIISFVASNNEMKNKIDSLHKKLYKAGSNINKLYSCDRPYYLGEISSIYNDAHDIICIVHEEQIQKIEMSERQDENKELKAFFENILSLIYNDFEQIKKFAKMAYDEAKKNNRPEACNNILYLLKIERNNILNQYNSEKSFDKKISILGNLIYSDLDKINNLIEKNKIKIINKVKKFINCNDCSCDYWHEFANETNLRVNTANANIDILNNLLKNIEEIKITDLESDLYKMFEYLKEDFKFLRDRLEDWLNIHTESYNKVAHEHYSEIESIHKEAYSGVIDSDNKQSYVKYSGTSIKGKVIFSRFLLGNANIKLSDEAKQAQANGKLVGAINTQEAGKRGIKILATAENLGISGQSPGIDDSYSITEVSEVEIKMKILSDIKIRVYIAYNKNTIGYPVKIANIKNNIRDGKLKLKSCGSLPNEIDFGEIDNQSIEDYSDYINELRDLRSKISKEKNKALKNDLDKLTKTLSKLDKNADATMSDYFKIFDDGCEIIENYSNTDSNYANYKPLFSSLIEYLEDKDFEKYMVELKKLKDKILNEEDKKLKENLEKLIKSLDKFELKEKEPNIKVNISHHFKTIYEALDIIIAYSEYYDYRKIFNNLCKYLTGENIINIKYEHETKKRLDKVVPGALKAGRAALTGGWAGLLGAVAKEWFGNSDSTKLDDSKKIDPKSVMKGTIIACTPIKSNIHKQGKKIESIESNMNPGYIWTTVSGSNFIINNLIKCAETLSSNINKSNRIACISDLTLSLQVSSSLIKKKNNIVEKAASNLINYASCEVSIRIYLTLSRLASLIENLIKDIKLKTKRGQIEIN